MKTCTLLVLRMIYIYLGLESLAKAQRVKHTRGRPRCRDQNGVSLLCVCYVCRDHTKIYSQAGAAEPYGVLGVTGSFISLCMDSCDDYVYLVKPCFKFWVLLPFCCF